MQELAGSTQRNFPPQLAQQLQERYGEYITDRITAEPRTVDLSHYESAPGGLRTMQYNVVRGPKPNGRRFLYIPGFAEVGLNKVSTAAEFAERGAEFVLPTQDRSDALVDPETGKPDATYTQAMNMLALYRQQQAEAEDEASRANQDNPAPVPPLHLISHSYGSLIIDRMVRIVAASNTPDLFRDAQVFLVAPADFRKHENVPSLAFRWGHMMLTEMDQKRPFEFPDKEGLTGKASMQTMARNIGRTLLEAKELIRGRVNLRNMAQHVGGVAVVLHGNDVLYTGKGFEKAIKREEKNAAKDGVYPENITWMSAVTRTVRNPGPDELRLKYGREYATHDDEQLSPSRVANAVDAVLDQKEALEDANADTIKLPQLPMQ